MSSKLFTKGAKKFKRKCHRGKRFRKCIDEREFEEFDRDEREFRGFGWRRLLIFLLVIATIFVFAAEGFGGREYGGYC